MNELETPLTYGPSEEQTGFEPVGKDGFRRIATAKWLVVTAIALSFLLSQVILPVFGRNLYIDGSITTVNTFSHIVCGIMMLIACWQLYGVPRQTYRVGAILLGSAWAYDVVCGLLVANLFNSFLSGTSDYLFGSVILTGVPPLILTLLSLIAFCWRGGANYGAASLIVAINVTYLGAGFMSGIPLGFVGTPSALATFFSLVLIIARIWAWWMFFEYSNPNDESDGGKRLTAKALLLNRITIGVCVVLLIMLTGRSLLYVNL